MYERIKVTTSNYVEILQSYKNYKLKSIKINLAPKENLKFANDILQIFNANKVEIIIDNNLSIQDAILSLEIPLNANIGTITEYRNYLYEQSSLYSFYILIIHLLQTAVIFFLNTKDNLPNQKKIMVLKKFGSLMKVYAL